MQGINYAVLKDTAEVLQVRISIFPKKIYLDTLEIVVVLYSTMKVLFRYRTW